LFGDESPRRASRKRSTERRLRRSINVAPHESAPFWTGVSVALLALAGITLGVAPAKQSVWADAGIAIAVLGALVLAGSVRLYFVHGGASQPTPLEGWLPERIEAAAMFARDRPVQGDKWYFDAMNDWDWANVNQMAFGEEGQKALAPDLVVSYREDPRTGHPDGFYPPHDGAEKDAAEKDRYYEQRLAWLTQTLARLKGKSWLRRLAAALAGQRTRESQRGGSD
jgi:hypothetical protein